MYSNHTNFAPRLGLAQSIPHLGVVAHIAYGIFYTPVDMNTWCNQRHNVPYVFPETSAERSLHSKHHDTEFPDAGSGHNGGQLHRPAVARAAAVYPAVERLA
jgi:ABC-type sulfate/molybdate transport systems ATPase subunit